jgi:uncharacterized protein (TIGR02391 family)
MSRGNFHEMLPDPESLLALTREELAGVVLQYLNGLSPDSGQLNRYNFSLPHTVEGYPQQYRDRISQALMEAWVWLEREGLLAPRPGTQGEWVYITPKGRELATPEDLKKYQCGNLLPRQLLHPRLAQKVWASFSRGDYDTAVFQAFKEVEVRVREVCKFSVADLGVALMRKAFDPDGGRLSDIMVPVAEREALAHLFAGAMGLYKNPHSHRDVAIEPQEAVEVIFLASHLLGIVDKMAALREIFSSRRVGMVVSHR